MRILRHCCWLLLNLCLSCFLRNWILETREMNDSNLVWDGTWYACNQLTNISKFWKINIQHSKKAVCNWGEKREAYNYVSAGAAAPLFFLKKAVARRFSWFNNLYVLKSFRETKIPLNYVKVKFNLLLYPKPRSFNFDFIVLRVLSFWLQNSRGKRWRI